MKTEANSHKQDYSSKEMKKQRNLDRDSLDFGNGDIPKLFRALFFPTLIGMVFNAVLTIIDGIFVGQGVGANGIAQST